MKFSVSQITMIVNNTDDVPSSCFKKSASRLEFSSRRCLRPNSFQALLDPACFVPLEFFQWHNHWFFGLHRRFTIQRRLSLLDAALTNREIQTKIIEQFDVTIGESTVSAELQNLGFHFRAPMVEDNFA
jgi:hypothetical protein